MIQSRWLLIAVGPAVVAAISATAQVPQGPMAEVRESLKALDVNGDGTIARDEVPADGLASFDRLVKVGDKDGDGKLGPAEIRDLFEKLRVLADPSVVAARFKEMDKDGDGKVTRAEFPGVPANFARFDANKDGVVSREEYLKGSAPPPPTPKVAGPPKPAAPAIPEKRQKRILAMDKDGDGKVTRAEWTGMPKGFEALDKDGDGVLSKVEIGANP